MRVAIVRAHGTLASVRCLAQELRTLGINVHYGPVSRREWPNDIDKVIHWGTPLTPSILNSYDCLTNYAGIELAINKFESLDALANHGVSVPVYGVISSAMFIARAESHLPIYLRTTRHRAGEGLKIINTIAELCETLRNQPNPPYTHWLQSIWNEHTSEYRIHCGKNNKIIHCQLKIHQDRNERDLTTEELSIRNRAHGWIFASKPIQRVPQPILDEARKAIRVLRLTFGGVDIIYNRNTRQAYVLEVNTAPSLRFYKTANAYARFIKELLDE